jgi:hypothetical protein
VFTRVKPYKVTLHFSHSAIVIECDDFSVRARNGRGPLEDIDFKNPTPSVCYFDPAMVLAITSEPA